MIENSTFQVPLHRLVLSLSEALDHVNPAVADHQLRVAYMAVKVAREMGFTGTQLRDVFHAAALHDIGLIKSTNRIRLISRNELEGIGWHTEAGYVLLKDNEFFTEAANIVRYHHALWNPNKPQEHIPLASYIISLVDTVDRNIVHNIPVLYQFRNIQDQVHQNVGNLYHPDCVKAFLEVSRKPAFWLDIASKRIYAILVKEITWPTVMIDEQAMVGISQIFARLVDSLSPWMGTHTAGVAESAVALAERMNFSPRKQILMRAAGYFHDLGKITVPSEILDKNGKLTEEEWAVMKGHTYYTYRIMETFGGMCEICGWAAYHHERLDGNGYPFGISGEGLSLGARIMAVADTFVAITEDRPYRMGMTQEKAVSILQNLVTNGALDERVVNALCSDYEDINSIRRKAQAAYSLKQRVLMETIGQTNPLATASPLL